MPSSEVVLTAVAENMIMRINVRVNGMEKVEHTSLYSYL